MNDISCAQNNYSIDTSPQTVISYSDVKVFSDGGGNCYCIIFKSASYKLTHDGGVNCYMQLHISSVEKFVSVQVRWHYVKC